MTTRHSLAVHRLSRSVPALWILGLPTRQSTLGGGRAKVAGRARQGLIRVGADFATSVVVSNGPGSHLPRLFRSSVRVTG